jgi:hypothetical protein
MKQFVNKITHLEEIFISQIANRKSQIANRKS